MRNFFFWNQNQRQNNQTAFFHEPYFFGTYFRNHLCTANDAPEKKKPTTKGYAKL